MQHLANSVVKKLSCRRETARRFVSLNIIFAKSLKITQGHSLSLGNTFSVV